MNGIVSDDIITVDEMCEILMIGKNMAYRSLIPERSDALR